MLVFYEWRYARVRLVYAMLSIFMINIDCPNDKVLFYIKPVNLFTKAIYLFLYKTYSTKPILQSLKEPEIKNETEFFLY